MNQAIRTALGVMAAVSAMMLSLSCASGDGGDSAGKAAMHIAKDGKTQYVIAVASDDLVANTAAKELSQSLNAATGATFPVVRPESRGSAPVIAVGPAAAKALAPDLDLDFKKLGDDGIVMKSVGPNLILSGADGGKRGSIYAVYEFLEREVGCRWWTSTESYIPKQPTLELPPMDTVYVPKLRYRDSFYLDLIVNGKFAAKCKTNGHWGKIPDEYGGHCKILGFCHTFYMLMPPKKYFKDHPEWYSEKDGKRTCEKGAQLCLANEEMRKELVKNALEWLRKNPGTEVISISQNDGCEIKYGCNCAKCSELSEREGSPSGPLIKFVNQVAEDIEKEFPKVYVETLAYQYTRKPPLTERPRWNVIVRYCVAQKSFSRPLSEDKACNDEVDILRSKIPSIFFWDYVANFRNFMQPYPNLRVLGPNIRYFAERNGFGVFAEGDNGSYCGDFVQLRAWLIAHLLWNPSLDENALIKEFMNGYYGAAAGPLTEYLDMVNDAGSKWNSGARTNSAAWFSMKDMNRANALFDKAAELVKGDQTLSKRVKRARMPLDFTWIRELQQLKFKAKLSGEAFQGPSAQQMAALCDSFIKSANEFGLAKAQYAEDLPFKNIEAGLRLRCQAKAPEMCLSLPEDGWFDVPNTDFGYWSIGNWVSIVDDEKASAKRAARMPANHSMWATYFNIPQGIDPTLLHVYAVIRCEVKPGAVKNGKSGFAFSAGIYGKAKAKNAALHRTPEEVADGEYRTYDLGVCDPKDEYVWVAPTKSPDMEAVYVDRIFFVKESPKSQELSTESKKQDK